MCWRAPDVDVLLLDVGATDGPASLASSSGAVRPIGVSDNPAEPISVLRSFAADNDYFVNF